MYYTTDRILEQSAEISRPVIALVAYRNSASEYYIETHDIDEKGQLLEGVPLSKECISDLVSGFSLEQSHMPFGKIPANLLYVDNRTGHEKYIWYNPPGQRMMYFTKDLNLENAMYYIPGVIHHSQSCPSTFWLLQTDCFSSGCYALPDGRIQSSRISSPNITAGHYNPVIPDNPDWHSPDKHWHLSH